MKFFDRFDKNERWILIISAIALVISSVLLFTIDDIGTRDAFNQNAEVGKIIAQQNDTRHKSDGSFVWYQSKQDQTIRLGDAVFAGSKSTAHIKLQKGGEMTVGENSLVAFTDDHNQRLANLSGGNFLLKFSGTMKVAVNGTLTELEGKNSEVQIFVAKGKKPQVRLVKGEAKLVKVGKPAVQLDAKTFETIEPVVDNTRSQASVEQEIKPPIPIEPPEIPGSLLKMKSVLYTWKLYDFYEQKDNFLFEREVKPKRVDSIASLSWSKSKDDKPSTVELSDSVDMKDSIQIDCPKEKVDFHPIYLGTNYWRVSYDKLNWSMVEKFEVVPGFLINAEPVPSVTDSNFPILSEKALQKVQLTTIAPYIGFVVQASTSEVFAKEHTRTFWSPSADLNLNFFHPGRYFYRFRTVTKNQEMSDWSVVSKFTVFRPKLPEAPALTKATNEVFVGEKYQARWSKTSQKTIIEVLDSTGRIIDQQEGDQISRVANKIGDLYLQAISIDEYDRPSIPSKMVKITVKEKPLPPPMLAKEIEKEEPKRKPSTIETSSVSKISNTTSVLNEKYKSSTFSIEGFIWTLQSTEQHYQNAAAPVASGVGLSGMHWFDHSGLEGKLKSGIFGANSTGQSTSMKDFEGRYHYRIFTGFPFSMSRELQISGFAGYEVYRNSGGIVSSQYDLMKFGTSLEFPWSKRMSAGGEFEYGIGTDKSTKKEISGHLNYFLSPDWSLGVGYRLHYFDAGSASSSAGGYLPYREGYSEGYSILNYHF